MRLFISLVSVNLAISGTAIANSQTGENRRTHGDEGTNQKLTIWSHAMYSHGQAKK